MKKSTMSRKEKRTLVRILVALGLFLIVFITDKVIAGGLGGVFIGPAAWVFPFCLYLVIYLIIGYDVLWKAIRNIAHGQVFDENFLMCVATLGAFALAIYRGVTGQEIEGFDEACAVLLFYQVGEWFQSYATGKSRKSIAGLMDIRPDYANIVRDDGSVETVDPSEVKVGDIILINPGEKIPLDGVIVKGASTLDTKALTGESLPREAEAGGEVISGCVNLTSQLEVRVTKEFYDSTVSKILDLVENASSRKSKSEDFISRFARIYTPAVCYAALALAILPPLVQMVGMGLAPAWETWIYRALTFLVASCPCALVISIPLSFFAGIGGASRAGVLVKGSNYLETLSQVKTLVFDKTGTLTQGVFEVNGIHHSELSDEKLVEYAALAESASSHPISKSLQRAYGKEIDRSRVTEIQEISGNGVIAKVDGVEVAAGNNKLMDRLGIAYISCHSVGTIIHMAINGKYAGHIVIADIVKPNSKEAIRQLKAAGVRKTVMLTGDAKKVADQVASSLGLDEVYSELLPADKVEKVEALLQAKPEREKLAFVGDGINDAPVLRRADIGIAMGAMGSDAAIEAADVVLMDDDPLQISKAIKISRKCLGIVYQNIVFSIAVKLACLILVAFGVANMWLAVFADVGVMILAILNAIRALRVQNL